MIVHEVVTASYTVEESFNSLGSTNSGLTIRGLPLRWRSLCTLCGWKCEERYLGVAIIFVAVSLGWYLFGGKVL